MKKAAKLLIFLIVLALVFYFGFSSLSFFSSIKNDLAGIEVLKPLLDLKERIITSTPLRGPFGQSDVVLEQAKIISQTNAERANFGAGVLLQSKELDRAASDKVDDMFAEQYFEHESPSGKGPGDLADEVGYEFILVGENLAMGNYKGEADLLEAWMNSPGHRANILNEEFTEIGVAVKKGLFEGREVWMAVQEFGRPLSDCKSPSGELEVQIDTKKRALEEMNKELGVRQARLDREGEDRRENYRESVEEYNTLVEQYNSLLNKTRESINQYNEQVRSFNNCVSE